MTTSAERDAIAGVTPSVACARLEAIVARLAHLEVLVVGDVMLDEYLVGAVDRPSPEAPVPVVTVEREVRALGGAGNVVRNLVALGARAKLCAVVGDDDEGRHVVDSLKELGVDTAGVVVDPARPTTRKTRVVARDRQMIRADRESRAPLEPDVRAALEARVGAWLPGADGVALVDYGKGVLAPEGARRLLAACTAAAVPVAVDPKGHLDAYVGARLVKPNAVEAAALLDGVPADPSARAQGLCARLPGSDVALTLGGAGMVVVETAEAPAPELVPTASLDVYDVQGAGDTTLAALWGARLAGASLVDAARIAHAAAGVAVAKVGTATASADELCARLPAVLEAAGTRASGGRR